MIAPPTYLISSHASYTRPLLHLLHTMARIDPQRIIVVIGGSAVENEQIMGGILVRWVTHNSYDYTGAIELVTQGWNSAEHVFLLHDTMEFGPRSERLIRQAEEGALVTAAEPGGQCNLLLCRVDYLRSMARPLQALCGCSKLAAIQAEGFLLRNALGRGHLYPGASCQSRHTGNPYGGALRVQEYYPAVDVLKWKANWGQNMQALEVRP